jgi:hypothetical protein
MNKLVFCVPCNIKMDINDCFKHKQTTSHMTKFESFKNIVRNQHIVIMQEGILFTTEEERQRAKDRRKLNKSNK